MNTEILKNVDTLYLMWKEGLLGGEVMPEDANPHLNKASCENYLYFTLPMALNYQRNSYTLWESANNTYKDKETNFVFNPKEVLNRTFNEVQTALIKYKVALQKTKQTEIWIKLCKTIVEDYCADIRNLFKEQDFDIVKIKKLIQKDQKDKFPYLSGNKICNYWLYVLMQYTDIKFKNVEQLTVAPDTHVIKATHKLGLITDAELNSSNVQFIVIDRWNKLLEGTKYKPIDLHTALWLWSRNGFKNLDYSVLDPERYKSKIKQAYETNDYIKKFRARPLDPFEKNVFDRVIKLLPNGASVLDLGCGNGYPYDNYFYKQGFNITGVDFSERFIAEAKEYNPAANYILSDIENYKIDKKYNLIMMLFSLLHVPRKNHEKILKNIYNNLDENGIFLLTLRDEDVGEIAFYNNFCNKEMYWSYYNLEKYKEILKNIGFNIIYLENQKNYGFTESHNWLILKKG